MKKSDRAAPVLLAVFIALACAPGANATIELKYQIDALGVQTIPTVSGPTVSVGGTIGGTFEFTFFGVGTNTPGTPGDAHMLMSTLEISNITGAAHTLQLWALETGFTLPAGPHPVKVSSHIGGTATPSSSNSLSFRSCVIEGVPLEACAAGSTVAGPGTPNITAGDSFKDDQFAMISNLGTPYSISQHLILTLAGGGSIGFQDRTTLTPTPEPATFLLVGGALFGTAAFLRRRRQTHA